MKIKSWFLLIISVTISLIIMVQVCFYGLYRTWNINTTASIIDAIANQTALQITTQYETVEDVALEIITNPYLQDYIFTAGISERLQHVNLVTNNISSAIFSNKGIKCVAIVNGDDILLNEFQGTEGEDCLYILEKAIKDSTGKMQRMTTISCYSRKGKAYFASSMDIFPINLIESRKDLYRIVIIFEIQAVQNYFEQMLDQNRLGMTITDSENYILTSDNTEEFGQIFHPEDKQRNYYLKIAQLQNPDWILYFMIPKTDLLAHNKPFGIFMFLMVLLNLAVVIFMIWVLMKNISASLSDIENEIEIICSGNWNRRIKYARKNELGNVVKHFNKLLNEYDSMNQKSNLMQEEIHQAKILQLRAQMDQLQEKVSPHFLFNSMEYIKSVALENNVLELADVACMLSQVFRYNLSDSKKVTIKEDLSYALNYFNVINARRPIPICLKVSIPPELAEKVIIKMVFQPILENILKHGDLEAEGYVEIVGKFLEGGYAEIRIKDNGRGICAEKLHKLQEALFNADETLVEENGEQHVGLLNIHKRLRLCYGAPCGLTIYSQDGQGMEVAIKILV